MWEDFVRGNWPAAASVMPDPVQLPSASSVVKPSHAKPPQAVTASYRQAEATSRSAAGKLGFKAAIAAGAGLALAVLVPGYAVAGSAHVAGAHAHAAAHAATSP
jgi:hypothetical protein